MVQEKELDPAEREKDMCKHAWTALLDEMRIQVEKSEAEEEGCTQLER
jgi:hypothetical protein